MLEWESKLSQFFPRWMRARVENRAKMFRYAAAARSRDRGYAPTTQQNPESSQYQRDRIKMMAEARDIVENTPMGSGVMAKLREYSAGRVRWVPRTGDRELDKEISDRFNKWCRRVDLAGRLSLSKYAQLKITSRGCDGDVGTQIVDGPDSLPRLVPIEADRIGNPMKTLAYSREYVSGMHLNRDGSINKVEVFARNDSTYEELPEIVPGNQFLHFPNLTRFDSIRGVTMFHGVLTRLRDIAETIGFEIASVKWASSITGLITRKAGLASPDEEDYFNSANTPVGQENRFERLETIEAGTLKYLNENEDIKQFMNQRPASAWQGFIQLMYREAATGLNLPYSFLYDPTGVMGTATRMDSSQAKRGFQSHQRDYVDFVLDDVKDLVLSMMILNGELPAKPNITKGIWLFVAHPTVDVGRESTANLAENRQGLRSGAKICGEEAEDIFEEQEQMAIEAANLLDLSRKYKVPVSMISTNAKDGNTSNEPIQGVAPANIPEAVHPQLQAPKELSHAEVVELHQLAMQVPGTELVLAKEELQKVDPASVEAQYLRDRIAELEGTAKQFGGPGSGPRPGTGGNGTLRSKTGEEHPIVFQPSSRAYYVGKPGASADDLLKGVGVVSQAQLGHKNDSISFIHTQPDFQRRGIAKALLGHIESHIGQKLKPNWAETPDGEAFFGNYFKS
jgi:capsid protein